jgi:hypothetical protein
MIHVPTYTGTPLLVTGGVLNQQVLQNAERLGRPSSESRTMVTMVSKPMAARELASHCPAAERDKAERLFAELLLRYRSIEDQFSIPRHDLAGALAAFIAGSHMAFNDAPFPDEYFKPLVRQMQRLLAASPAVAQARWAIGSQGVVLRRE